MKQRDQRKAKRTKAPEAHERLLHFSDGEVWSWRYGGSVIKIREPDLRTNHDIHLSEITGMTFDDMERGEWKGWWKGVGPQEIKDYIALHLRPTPAFPVPLRVYVHQMKREGGRWHLYFDCGFARNSSPQDSIDPEMAAEHIGGGLTRRNLCGVCMHRYSKKRLAV